MKKGFTLIEILVVITIIVILGGITLMGASRIKTRARIDATKSLMAQLTLALNNYYAAYFAYPPSSGQYTGSQNLYYFLGLELDLEQGYDPTTGQMMKQKFGPAFDAGFKQVQLDDQNNVLDPWGTPISYTNPGIDHSPGKDNSSFVDISSAGPDRTFEGDSDPNYDDIDNWQIEKPLSP